MKPVAKWKNLLVRLIWVAVIGTVGYQGWKWYSGSGTTVAVKFETKPTTRGTVEETVLTTGTLGATQTVDVGSQVSGMVTHMYVDWNSPVHKGQIIAEIDPRVSQEQMVQAEADMDTARAGVLNNQAGLQNTQSNLKTMGAGVESAQADVETSQGGIVTAQAQLGNSVANLDKAKAQLHVADLTYHRDTELRAQDLISQSDLDQAQANRDVAVADVETAQGQVAQSKASLRAAQIKLRTSVTAVQTAREKLDAAQSQVQGAMAQLEAAQASVKKAEANTEQFRFNLSYTIIRSPVDGVVLERNVDQGQTIQASYTTPELYKIGTNLQRMQVVANVSESDLSRVYPGEKADFTVDAYPVDKFDGKVTQVRDKATTTDNVVTYQVVIVVNNPDLKLRPGMTANITLKVRSHKKALLASNAALRWKPQLDPSATPEPKDLDVAERIAVRHGVGIPLSGRVTVSPKAHQKLSPLDRLPDETDHQKVWVLKDGKPVSIDVTTGLVDDSNTEILSGLKEGQDIIVGATYPPKAERKDLF